MAPRCDYRWAIVAHPQAPSVIAYVQCKNRTLAPDGRCHIHHGAHGRYDRRTRSGDV